MYAVFRTGGKQYRARQGERLRIESLKAAVGDAVAFEDVLLVGEGASVKVGAPLVKGGKSRPRSSPMAATTRSSSSNSGAVSTTDALRVIASTSPKSRSRESAARKGQGQRHGT